MERWVGDQLHDVVGYSDKVGCYCRSSCALTSQCSPAPHFHFSTRPLLLLHGSSYPPLRYGALSSWWRSISLRRRKGQRARLDYSGTHHRLIMPGQPTPTSHPATSTAAPGLEVPLAAPPTAIAHTCNSA